MTISKFGVGQAIFRSEDDPLLRGAGRYVADHTPTGTLHAVVLRSTHAHATFRITDVEKARALPGVRLVLTAAEIPDLGPLPCQGVPAGVEVDIPFYPILARDQVLHVGDSIAFVVGDTVDAARNGAEAIVIEYDAKPHVVGAEAALAKGAPQIWPQAPGNLAFSFTLGDEAKTKAAFAGAARTVSLKVVNQRLVTNYMDTRGVIAEYDDATERFTLTLGSQGSHIMQDVLCDDVLKIDKSRMRVITPDVGGGFGTKLFPYREYALAAVAAQRLKKPVKWISDRSEHFLADSHGRDNITTATLALNDKGKFLGLEVETIADMGAYLSCYAPYIPYVGVPMLPGVYDIPACHIRVLGVYTNTVPVDAYRGAGRPEASYVIERLVDTVARELGIATDTIRKRNFIKPSAMPYATATGKTYDTGEFLGHLERAQEMADWGGFNKRLAQSKKAGLLRGIGIGTYIEACGGNGPETATLRLDKDGGITLLIGSQSTGQGHQTAYAQLLADEFGLPPDMVRMVQGDTDQIKTGAGTGGSSSIPAGGPSVVLASKKLAENLKTLASDVLEAAPSDLEIIEGVVRVAGTDRSVPFAELARKGETRPELLTAADAFKKLQATYPNGTHVVEVEIDPATGHTAFANYVVVDDFGVSLNPLLLAGQVHGGAVQGIGQALMEDTTYDADTGQLLAASLMDYALPRAGDVPPFAFETRNVPCKVNPLGVKGAGEAGAIGSCPAVMNAIVDALWRAYRVKHIDMPATPERVWAAIEEGKRVHTL